MSHGSTIGPTQLADLLAALEMVGAESLALAASVGLSIPDPADPHARVPSSFVIRLFDAAEKSLSDPLIGLHAGACTLVRGPLFFLLLSTSRVSEGLRLISRFASVTVSTLELRVSARGRNIALTIDPGDAEISHSHHTVDYLVGASLSLFRRAIPGFRLLSVDLIHPEIGPAGETARVLGCPVHFGRPRTVLRFPDETLDEVPAAASPLIAKQIEKLAESLLPESEPTSLPDRVAGVVRQLLSSGQTPDPGRVADEMHLSVRTLQRHLLRESLSFRDIRDGVRLEIAQALLAKRALPVKTVAENVGFADTAAFSKAFTRWTGHTPTSYRLQQLFQAGQSASVEPAGKRR
jgi:AraC-like DNA-binding protein